MMVSTIYLLPFIVLNILPTSTTGFQLKLQHDTIQRSIRTYNKSQRFATVSKSDEEWRAQLSPEAYRVLRQDGTEGPWTSDLNEIKEIGTFVCAGCQSPLFRTSAKFDSGTGWPSFYTPIDENAISLSTDFKLVLPRTECRCAVCDGHLGHVFDDGPEPTGQRFCMNGVSMIFQPDDLAEETYVSSMVERESKGQFMKPPISSVLPSFLLYAGAAALYGNTFLTRWISAKDMGTSFPSNVFDYFPLGIGGICLYLAAKGVSRLFL